MKVALIGASGFIGSALLDEALARGHQVKALVRNPQKIETRPGLQAAEADVFDAQALAGHVRGSDAVITAFSGHSHGDVRADYLRGLKAIVDAVRLAGVPRLLVVGGAGSLFVAPGLQLVDTPQFPEQWKGSALGAREGLAYLQQQQGLDWTLLSPAALIQPGERTGKFRLGGDDLLRDAQGESRISLQDYALAMLDELEKPAHSRKRFTVAY